MRINTKCEYDNDGERITSPGKFEGEPIFAPYYWDLAMQGFADSDNGTVAVFHFTKAQFGSKDPQNVDVKFAAELQAWLGRKRTLRMQEDSQGFVHCF